MGFPHSSVVSTSTLFRFSHIFFQYLPIVTVLHIRCLVNFQCFPVFADGISTYILTIQALPLLFICRILCSGLNCPRLFLRYLVSFNCFFTSFQISILLPLFILIDKIMHFGIPPPGLLSISLFPNIRSRNVFSKYLYCRDNFPPLMKSMKLLIIGTDILFHLHTHG